MWRIGWSNAVPAFVPPAAAAADTAANVPTDFCRSNGADRCSDRCSDRFSNSTHSDPDTCTNISNENSNDGATPFWC